MALLLNIPDEFVHGSLKATEGLLEGYVSGFGSPASGPAQPPVFLVAQAQARYWERQLALWMSMLVNKTGKSHEPIVTPEQSDRRFQAEGWHDNPWYSLLRQSYLLNSRLLFDVVEAAQIDQEGKQRLRFYMQQFIDSMSPTNFAATNPEVLKLALESKGESLRAGFANLLDDLKRGRIAITDETAFEVGVNVAVSQGAVVFENELFQLLQYTPLTDKVATRPLLIVPPCINKFYILDLQPENSFVRFACEQGLTVFVVSWRNVDRSMAKTTWNDYIESGALRAIEVAHAIGGSDQINVVGWCVGGTILSSALAVMRARGDETVASLTLLTTMLDFSDPGDLGVFIDEQVVSQREQAIGRGGIYAGKELGFVFQTLRANDLIWPYVVGNYLKGKKPAAFDLLYWNADNTNLPGPMYAWYLRNMYLENNLCLPGRLTMCNEPIDLGRIDVPSYVLATQEDHIVPWRSAYRTTQLLGGKVQFVLGASGHIAGVINPALKNKRSYWVDGRLVDDADQWLESAQAVPGSWWSHWVKWLKPQAGKSVPARKSLGNSQYMPIEPAPGRYVKERAD